MLILSPLFVSNAVLLFHATIHNIWSQSASVKLVTCALVSFTSDDIVFKSIRDAFDPFSI
jgi:hypothetical protein